MESLATALIGAVLGAVLGFLGSLYVVRRQLGQELRHAREEYAQERRDRAADYSHERTDREVDYKRERQDRALDVARETRQRDDRLLAALMSEMEHNAEVCRECFNGLRYGTTQHSAMAATLGVELAERARQAIRRAYAFAAAYDDFVRSLTPEARMLTATYDTSALGQSAAAARDYARTAQGHFEDARQHLKEAMTERAARGSS